MPPNAVPTEHICPSFSIAAEDEFTDFVNNCRIDTAAVKLMKEYPYMPVGEIAIRSGFGSVATFRRAFIRRKGVTPRQFKAEVLKQEKRKSVDVG